MFFNKGNVKEIASVKPYTPLEVVGRDIYLREGCYNCHSQLVRPFRYETERYGEYSKAGEYVYDHPFQWGSKRTGPDLHRVGGKYPSLWHVRHMGRPDSTTPGSVMPRYPHLLTDHFDTSLVGSKMRALRAVGVPYTDGEIETAAAAMASQAKAIAAEVEAQQGPTGLADKEITALTAYLQRLGTDIKWTERARIAAATPRAPAAAADFGGAVRSRRPWAAGEVAMLQELAARTGASAWAIASMLFFLGGLAGDRGAGVPGPPRGAGRPSARPRADAREGDGEARRRGRARATGELEGLTRGDHGTVRRQGPPRAGRDQGVRQPDAGLAHGHLVGLAHLLGGLPGLLRPELRRGLDGGRVPRGDTQSALTAVQAHFDANPLVPPSPAELLAGAKDPAVLEVGAARFARTCASCHGEKAQGLIGPNLTDDRWIHGGIGRADLPVRREGLAGEGDAAVGPRHEARGALGRSSPTCRSLQGSNPPNAKPAEGDPVAPEPIPGS